MKSKLPNRTDALPGVLTSLHLIEIETFAQAIHWHPESLRRACRQGRVAGAVKLGRGWRIPQLVAADILKTGIPLK